MITSTIEARIPDAEKVSLTDAALQVSFSDGRTISVPLYWYPRLVHATREERDNWELIGEGEGIRWPDLDEDLSVEDLIAGRPSGESESSSIVGLKREKTYRQATSPTTLSLDVRSLDWVGSRIISLYRTRRRESRLYSLLYFHLYKREF